MKNLSNYVFAIFTALCLIALPALADSALAELVADPAGISFNLRQGDYDAVTITINGPGDLSLRETFAAGDAPVFSLSDEAGNVLPDGTYSYELRAQPRLNAGLRAEIEAARAVGDTAAPARLRADGQLPEEASLVQSGYFSVIGGSVVVPDQSVVEIESRDAAAPVVGDEIAIPLKDFVIVNDDLIVQGDLCVGIDCIDGENFGTDSIRHKDNNIRIKLDDTTSAGGFPLNDWQLTINDSAQGGAERFSIDDVTGATTPLTIEAGAPSHALYVEDSGDLGLGTMTPEADLHVINGNTPTLRLEQDGSNGLTPQTWDVAGNDASFSIRDATNGSAQVFSIQPGAPTSSLFVEASGDVGIGTNMPGQKLDVIGGNIQARRDDGGQTSFFITSTGGTTDLSYILRTNPNLAGVGGFAITSAGVSPFRIFNGAASRTLDITTTGVSVEGVLRLAEDSLPSQQWDVLGTNGSFSIRDATNGATQPFRIQPGAPTDALFVESSGDVGIGTSTPRKKLEVVGGDIQARRTDDSDTSLFITSDGGSAPLSHILRTSQTLSATGGFAIIEAGTSGSPFKILRGALNNSLVVTTDASGTAIEVGIGTVNPAGTLDVNGSIFQRNLMTHADYVFEPDFPLETIEEHAAFMWENKHLPALKPAQYDDQGRSIVELGASQNGMLEELEKAHIYIDQLNNDVNELTDTLEEKNEKLAALEALTEALSARLARLEAQ